jgi:ParB/Sulfiredoxin domain
MSISSSSSVVMVNLDQIPAGTVAQARVKIRNDVVRHYAAAMVEQHKEGGVRFPPVVLFTDGQDYWLADGWHRVLAARRAGLSEIAADVRPGTERVALLCSVSANSGHGLPRTNADKRKAVALRSWEECGARHLELNTRYGSAEFGEIAVDKIRSTSGLLWLSRSTGRSSPDRP